MAYNHYEKEFKGPRIHIGDVLYEFSEKVPDNKAGTKFKYRYIPMLTEAQIERESKAEDERGRILMIWEIIDTTAVIKGINAKIGGKIEGRSKTTSSIYSFVKETGIRVRVAKHQPVAKRSSSTVEVTIHYNGTIDANAVRACYRDAKTAKDAEQIAIDAGVKAAKAAIAEAKEEAA